MKMASHMSQRRTDLDALRGFAMLLGIALHASLSFFAVPWPVYDTLRSNLLPLFASVVHGFRMPLFFLLSGYFTMLVYRRRGLQSLLE
jgi:fucose 4-O-acetylase-like acetyltransferase